MNENSFERGWEQVPIGKASDLRDRICDRIAVLNGRTVTLTTQAFRDRLHGKTQWTRREASAVEQAFIDVCGWSKTRASKIWGYGKGREN